MLNDIRAAFRNVRHAPGLSIVIVLTLALGIGANTAFFSVVNTLVFEPLPYSDADRLVSVYFDNDTPTGFHNVSHPKFLALQKADTPFEAVAAYGTSNVTVTTAEFPERVEAEIVSASYFNVLRTGAAKGRVFTEAENREPNESPVVVLSHAFWRDRLGSDPAALGTSLMIRDRQYRILGVMPPEFRGQAGTAELWIPAMMADHVSGRGMATSGAFYWMRIIGRLAPGVSIDVANERMPGVTARVKALEPSFMKPMQKRDGTELLKVASLKATKVNPDVSRAFLLLLGAVGAVVLIACANTANLLLGRAVTRRREFAVRRAIGASGARLARAVLVESALLALAAGLAGVLVAVWTLDWVTTAKPWNTSGLFATYVRTFEYFDVRLDGQALLFNFALALLVGVVFGMAPAWQAARADLTSVLKDGAAGSAGAFHSDSGLSARAALVLTEIAFSIVLLVAAGLTIRSFAKAASVDLGFAPDRLVTMTISPSGRKPPAFYGELLQRLQALPGVERAALSAGTPLGPGGWAGGEVEVEGRLRGDAAHLEPVVDTVSPEFFAVYSTRFAEGGGFSAEQRNTGVAVVNRKFAEAIWPGQSAVGRRFKHELASPRLESGESPQSQLEWVTVVGVIENVAQPALEAAPLPTVYVPIAQLPQRGGLLTPNSITLRTALHPTAAAAAVRAAVHSLDGNAPVHSVVTLAERADRVTSRYRYSMLMMGGMALLALLLATTGTYGVLAYSVSARTREIGIRVALGASPVDLVRWVLISGLKLTWLGIALGLVGAFAASRLLGTLMFGVNPYDPLTFAGTTVLMGLVATAACYIPARRAVGIDPIVALRRE